MCRNSPAVGNGEGPRNISTFYVVDTQGAQGEGPRGEDVSLEQIEIVNDILFQRKT